MKESKNQSMAHKDTVAVDQMAILEGIPNNVVTSDVMDREFRELIE